MSDKEYFKKYYLEHKGEMLNKQVVKWRRAQAYLAEIKMKPCMDCGFVPEIAGQMDFDHVRGEKKNILARMAAKGASIASMQEEIEKCDLVCANCHRLRTAKRRKRSQEADGT